MRRSAPHRSSPPTAWAASRAASAAAAFPAYQGCRRARGGRLRLPERRLLVQDELPGPIVPCVGAAHQGPVSLIGAPPPSKAVGEHGGVVADLANMRLADLDLIPSRASLHGGHGLALVERLRGNDHDRVIGEVLPILVTPTGRERVLDLQ